MTEAPSATARLIWSLTSDDTSVSASRRPTFDASITRMAAPRRIASCRTAPVDTPGWPNTCWKTSPSDSEALSPAARRYPVLSRSSPVFETIAWTSSSTSICRPVKRA